ncbi:hypothetical protein BU26DRAFT_588076 [Trematosphaeria pertusa]|uniref:Uncharacterized protein n=1 Tax=Trematosphaeria pertusa TaxID=390896 RepID=A0A6A6IRX3_9PLEO|nr:uncharacterized protein BU26DRAFT_588076 [Trematosphaeria pertusa]KAF2253241.1 hypothetical protein BU26DRAFT_588076 [Trematosphaeria pertusa]
MARKRATPGQPAWSKSNPYTLANSPHPLRHQRSIHRQEHTYRLLPSKVIMSNNGPTRFETALKKSKTFFSDLVDRAKTKAKGNNTKSQHGNANNSEGPKPKVYSSNMRAVTQEELATAPDLGAHGWGDQSWQKVRGEQRRGTDQAVKGAHGRTASEPGTVRGYGAGLGDGAGAQALPRPQAYRRVSSTTAIWGGKTGWSVHPAFRLRQGDAEDGKCGDCEQSRRGH